jgi:hypothetical protein
VRALRGRRGDGIDRCGDGEGMGTNAAGMGWGRGQAAWGRVGMGRNLYVRGGDGDKMLSPCHSLIHTYIRETKTLTFTNALRG